MSNRRHECIIRVAHPDELPDVHERLIREAHPERPVCQSVSQCEIRPHSQARCADYMARCPGREPVSVMPRRYLGLAARLADPQSRGTRPLRDLKSI